MPADARRTGYLIAVTGAALGTLGGVVDALVPRLLPHHEAFLGVASGAAPAATAVLVLLLLHTLGAALVGLGVATMALLVAWRRGAASWTGWAAVGAFAVGEATNAIAIARVGSPIFLGPLACVLAVTVGVAVGGRAERRAGKPGAIRAIAMLWLASSLSFVTACAVDTSSGTKPDGTGALASGPTVPIPAGLWRPPAGSTPASGTYLYLDVDQAFSPGVTYPRTILPSAGRVTVSPVGGTLSVSVTASDTVIKLDVRGRFTTMLGHARLEEGYYHDLRGPADADPLRGSLDVTLNGRGCSPATGWFVVDHVFYFNGLLTALDLRFEQRCPGFSSPMHGQLHWTENLT